MEWRTGLNLNACRLAVSPRRRARFLRRLVARRYCRTPMVLRPREGGNMLVCIIKNFGELNRSFDSGNAVNTSLALPFFLDLGCLITKKSLFTQLGRKFTVYIGLLMFFREKNVKQEEIYNMLMVLGEIRFRFRDSRRHDTVASRFSTKIPSIVQQKIKDRPTG